MLVKNRVIIVFVAHEDIEANRPIISLVHL